MVMQVGYQETLPLGFQASPDLSERPQILFPPQNDQNSITLPLKLTIHTSGTIRTRPQPLLTLPSPHPSPCCSLPGTPPCIPSWTTPSFHVLKAAPSPGRRLSCTFPFLQHRWGVKSWPGTIGSSPPANTAVTGQFCCSFARVNIFHLKSNKRDFPSGAVVKESVCQCRGHGFEPRSGKIPHATEQRSPCATTTEPAVQSPRATTTEPMCHNY